MRDEREMTEEVRDLVDARIARASEPYETFTEARTGGLPETETAFTITLVDGTKFLVALTKIEEGQ
jgi:hypothetical protein